MTAAGRTDDAGKRFDAPAGRTDSRKPPALARFPRTERLISYSRKVFIPLTKLCRDVLSLLHVSRKVARARGKPVYLSPDEVLAIAHAGAAAGCTEALFTAWRQA